jgi:hypothetical protein
LSLHFFDPGVVDRNILQSQFDDSLLQEGGFFLDGVDHADRQIWSGDGQRDAGQAAAAADVEQWAWADMRQDGQRVEQVVRNGLFRIAQGGQVVGLVPLEQQVAEGEQLLPCASSGRAMPSSARPADSECWLMRLATGCGALGGSAAAKWQPA